MFVPSQVFIIVKLMSVILGIILTFLLGCRTNHVERIKIQPELQYFVEEWVMECKKYNVDYNSALSHIDSIHYMEFDYLDKLGEHNREDRRISINTQVLKKNHYFQRLIIFHELGHALKLPHVCGKMSIMNPYLPHEHVEDYNLWWDDLMKDYFTDTTRCANYIITKDSMKKWVENYNGYCDYSNSTIGPR